MSDIKIGELSYQWAQKTNFDCEYKDSIESTNNLGKENLTGNKSSCLFLTDFQSKGRGRGSNKWTSSTPGSGFYSSWVFKLDKPPQPIASPLFGLAVFNSLKGKWPSLELSIKPPNDIFLDQSKLGGILLESVSRGDQHHLIVGIGLNIFESPGNLDIPTDYLTSPQGTGQSLSATDWFEFLDLLSGQLRSATEECQSHKLSSSSKEQLLMALNRFPKKKEVFVEISDQGDLTTENQTITWMDFTNSES